MSTPPPVRKTRLLSTHLRAGICAICAGGLLLAVGCEQAREPLGPDTTGPSRTVSPDPSREATRTVARLLAIALADEQVRADLFALLRDSPFPQRAVHLSSFLAGPDASDLRSAMEARSGVPVLGVDGLLAGAPPLELVMVRSLDRLQWTGKEPLEVYAAPEGMRGGTASGHFEGYDAAGRTVLIGAFEFVSRPYVFVRPVTLSFPADPESARRAAPIRSGAPITTRGEERLMMAMTECDPETAIIECPEDPPMGGGQVGYTLDPSITFDSCTAGGGPDLDNDGILDTCEHALAFAFRPQLIMNPGDDAPFREPHWSVRIGDGPNEIEVFYLFAYHRDAGTVPGGLTSHDGDSEFVIATLRNPVSNHSRWVLERAFLSAHWGTPLNGSASYTWDWLEPHDVWGGRPRIWVAKNKHANYRSKSVCNSGALLTDTCNGNVDLGALSVPSHRNIGNKWSGPGAVQLIDQVYSGYGHLNGVEYFWTADRFKGWHTASTSAGGYMHPLYNWGF